MKSAHSKQWKDHSFLKNDTAQSPATSTRYVRHTDTCSILLGARGGAHLCRIFVCPTLTQQWRSGCFTPRGVIIKLNAAPVARLQTPSIRWPKKRVQRVPFPCVTQKSVAALRVKKLAPLCDSTVQTKEMRSKKCPKFHKKYPFEGATSRSRTIKVENHSDKGLGLAGGSLDSGRFDFRSVGLALRALVAVHRCVLRCSFSGLCVLTFQAMFVTFVSVALSGNASGEGSARTSLALARFLYFDWLNHKKNSGQARKTRIKRIIFLSPLLHKLAKRWAGMGTSSSSSSSHDGSNCVCMLWEHSCLCWLVFSSITSKKVAKGAFFWRRSQPWPTLLSIPFLMRLGTFAVKLWVSKIQRKLSHYTIERGRDRYTEQKRWKVSWRKWK